MVVKETQFARRWRIFRDKLMWRPVAYWLLCKGRTASFVVAIVIGLGTSLKAPRLQPQEFAFLTPNAWAQIVDFQAWFSDRQWIVLALVAAYGAATKARDYFGPPVFWKLVNGILTRFRDEVFQGERDNSPLHRDRVTLFRRKEGYLVAVARAGDGPKCTVKFRAEEGFDPDSVASAVCLSRRTIPLYDLPELTHKSTKTTINEYAEKTFASAEWITERIAKKQQCSCAFLGFPIEIDHKIWGVLLIDSLEPNLPNQQVCQTKLEGLSIALGLLLEHELVLS